MKKPFKLSYTDIKNKVETITIEAINKTNAIEIFLKDCPLMHLSNVTVEDIKIDLNKYKAKIVNVTNKGIIDKNGYNKAIHITDHFDNFLYLSNSHHPEGIITTIFHGIQFICPSGYDEVFMRKID